MIILCSEAPTMDLLSRLDIINDGLVGIVVGSPKWVPDLERAGIREAAHIICPAADQVLTRRGVHNAEDFAMVDADGVMLYQILDALGITCRATMLFEFKRIHNINLLPKGTWTVGAAMCGTDSDEFNGGSSNSIRKNTLYGMLASGGISNLGRTSKSYDPLLLESMAEIQPRTGSRSDSREMKIVNNSAEEQRASVMGDQRESRRVSNASKISYKVQQQRTVSRQEEEKPALAAEGPRNMSFGAMISSHPKIVAGQVFAPVTMGSMLARTTYTSGAMEVTQALLMPEDQGDMFLWQIRAGQLLAGRTFRDCWLELIKDRDGPALAIGLYRFLTEDEKDAEEDPPIAYVMTNPPKDAVVRESDLAYVLAPARWGRRMHEEGHLLQAGAASPGAATAP